MKSEKGQSLVMVGVALFLLAGLCLYLGLSQPKISSGVLVETPTTAVQSGTTTRSAAATVGRSAASRTATAAQTWQPCSQTARRSTCRSRVRR